MEEKKPLKYYEFILPFWVPSEDRRQPFNDEMNKAAIFSFAELERLKGGGRIRKKPSERTVFIAEICYPFWYVPFGKTSLVFDGLNSTSHTLTYSTIPNLKAFMENLERSSKKLETHMAFLSNNTNYFQTIGEKQKIIDGLITDPDILKDLRSYFAQATQVKASPSDKVTLSPTLDGLTILSMRKEMENQKRELTEEIDLLYLAMKTLESTSGDFIEKTRSEINAIEVEYAKEKKKHEKIIRKQIERTQKEYDEEITKVTKRSDEHLLRLHREKIMNEKAKEQTLSRVERYRTEAKTCFVNKDLIGERKWKEAIKEQEKRIPIIDAKIEELDAKTKEIAEKKSLDLFKLRTDYDTKTREVRKDFVEIEVARDAKILVRRQKMEQLEELTQTIIGQIDKLAKMRESTLAGYDSLGTHQELKECALVYMPFYLVLYESKSKKRYLHFPASIVGNIGFSVRFKGALGKAKISGILAPRFDTIVSFLNKFPLLIEQNAVFERELNEASAKASILRDESARAVIRSGLKQLKEEGWFSEDEHEIFQQELA